MLNKQLVADYRGNDIIISDMTLNIFGMQFCREFWYYGTENFHGDSIHDIKW